MPLMMPSPNMIKSSRFQVPRSKLPKARKLEFGTWNLELEVLPSPIHLPQHNIHAAENDDDVRDVMPKAHVFEQRQVDEARRADAIPIRIRRAVADEIKAEFAFGSFDAAVRFAGF